MHPFEILSKPIKSAIKNHIYISSASHILSERSAYHAQFSDPFQADKHVIILEAAQSFADRPNEIVGSCVYYSSVSFIQISFKHYLS